MKKNIYQAFMIAVLFLTLKGGSAFISPNGYSLMAEQGKATNGFKMVNTAELQSLLKEKANMAIVDSRSPEEFMLGHIPGAMNIPEDKVDSYFQKFQQKLKQAEIIIVYCSGGSCGTSEAVAAKLITKGILRSKIAVSQDGLPGWIKAKNPLERGEQK